MSGDTRTTPSLKTKSWGWARGLANERSDSWLTVASGVAQKEGGIVAKASWLVRRDRLARLATRLAAVVGCPLPTPRNSKQVIGDPGVANCRFGRNCG